MCFLSKKLDIFFFIGYTKIVSIVFVKWYGFNNFINKKKENLEEFCKVELLYPLCQKHWFNEQFNKIRKWLKKEITFEIEKFFIFSNSKKIIIF